MAVSHGYPGIVVCIIGQDRQEDLGRGTTEAAVERSDLRGGAEGPFHDAVRANLRQPSDDSLRQAHPDTIPEPRRPGRSVATWASQDGEEPPRSYVSVAPWERQLQVAADLDLSREPRVFRGRTPRESLAAHPVPP